MSEPSSSAPSFTPRDRSSGSFFIVAMVFLVLTGVIHGIPSASADLLRRVPMIGPEFEQPAPLENQVSVSDVQSSYQTVKNGRVALVVTGVVENNSGVPFHTVQIGVRLLDDAQHELASSAVYCGTTLSQRMIGEMTPHELEFLQKLEPQKAFALEPAHAAPFLMVFIDPPRDVRHLAVAVSKAAAARGASPGELAALSDHSFSRAIISSYSLLSIRSSRSVGSFICTLTSHPSP